MIDRKHALLVLWQAELAGISCGSVYYLAAACLPNGRGVDAPPGQTGY